MDVEGNDLEARLAELGGRLADLEARFAQIDGRVAQLADHLMAGGALQAQDPTRPDAGTGRAPGLGAVTEAGPPSSPLSSPPSSAPPPPRPEDAVVAPATGSGRPPAPRFEVTIEAVLRWVGIALVVLAAVFLVSTAIERGWIGPRLQLLGAATIGAAMLGSAIAIEPRRRPWAVALGNGGAVVLVVCAGATYGWLELWGPATALAVVALATAVAVAAAARLRLESVAVTAVATMLVVPAWARIVADAPVLAIGAWLGGFALVATAVGVDRRWPAFRLVSIWAAALWVIGLAGFLHRDGDTSHLTTGAILVAVVGAVLWSTPLLSAADRPGPRPEGTAARRALSLRAVEVRSVAAVPLWAWCALVLFGGLLTDGDNRFEVGSPGGYTGLALAGGFIIAAATGAGVGNGQLPTSVAGSHLLGAGLLVTATAVAWIGGSVLLVVLAGQALITLVLARRLVGPRLRSRSATAEDGGPAPSPLAGVNPLYAQALALAVLALGVLATSLAEAVDRARFSAPDSLAQGLALLALAAVAALFERDHGRRLAEPVWGVLWGAAVWLVASLAVPVVAGRVWLPVGVAVALAGAVASVRFGRWVLAGSAAVGALTLAGGAAGILVTLVDGGTVADHLSQLAVVAGSWAVAVALWRRPGPGPADAARAALLVAWVLSLGWVAALFLAEIDGSQGQVAVSAVWAAAAGAAIVAAIRSGEGVMRVAGMGTLVAVLAKLLTVDLAEVDTLWRVGLFLVVGLGLLRLGYLLPRLARPPAGSGA